MQLGVFFSLIGHSRSGHSVSSNGSLMSASSEVTETSTQRSHFWHRDILGETIDCIDI
jgi:hypothetical protein